VQGWLVGTLRNTFINFLRIAEKNKIYPLRHF
jgi:hypothetical protein